MKKIILPILFLPLLAHAQTRPIGYVVGNQTVINVPVATQGYPLAQALIYYPDDYFLPKNANKRYPLFVFLHGAGEGAGTNIDVVTNTSLPNLIKNGLKPYGIDLVTNDTIKYIVVSPFCANCGGSYSYPQLKYTIPFLFTTYRVDTSCVWVGGLSSGGRGTWSMVMGDGDNPSAADTINTKRLTGILPMANGGYDNAINIVQCRANLDTTARRGLRCLYVIGDQDPGYNQIGFFAYQAEMKKYCSLGMYLDKVIVGGTHSTNVWNLPFPLTARLWSTTMNTWTQMWTMRKNKASAPPPVNPLHAKIWTDSLTISYPNTSFHLSDSSAGKHNFVSWGAVNYPIGSPGRWSGGQSFQDIYFFNLTEGIYKVQLVIGDDAGNYDTAYVNLRVYGPPACPMCPACPAPRTVKAVQAIINGQTFSIPIAWLTFTYSDGKP